MRRKITLSILVLFILGVTAAWCCFTYINRHFYDNYDPALPLEAKEQPPVAVDATAEVFGQQLPAKYRRIAFTYLAREGEEVPALLTLPLTGDGPFPVVVFLHGSDQEKEFVEEICTPLNEAGFAVAGFDQYMRASRKVEGGPLTIAMAYRARCWKTVNDARRLMDCLETRPDIAKDRIYLIGVSYGAITGTALVAQEKRIQAADLIVGGGNLKRLVGAPDIRKHFPGWAYPLVKAMVTLVAGPAEPLLHAPKTAGTPVLMQNGRNDNIVIPECGEALFKALGEPKEIRWYPVDHPDREKNGAEVIKLIMDGVAWIAAQDADTSAHEKQ